MRGAWLVFLAFLALYVLTAGGHLYSPDEEVMFRTTESIADRFSLAVEPIIGPDGKSFATREGTDGFEFAQYGVGNSLFAVPFYYVGKLAVTLIGDAAAAKLLNFETTKLLPEGAGGEAMMKRFAVSFFGSVIGALTCTLLWMFVFQLAGDAPGARVPSRATHDGHVAHDAQDYLPASQPRATTLAWLTTIGYGAGTMAWPHARTFFSEPLATLFILWSFYLLSTGLPRLPRTFAAGAIFALALLTRLDSIVVLPALALVLVLRLIAPHASELRDKFSGSISSAFRPLLQRSAILAIVAFATPLLLFGIYQLILNKALYGAFITTGYADQTEGVKFTTPLLAGLYGFLFSIGKSVFLFSPILIIALFGFSRFVRRWPAQGIGAAAAIVLLLLFHSRWQNWAGGWCWGPRHIFTLHVFACLGIVGFALDWSRFGRISYATVLAAAIFVQLYGCSQNFIDYYVLYYRTPYTQPNAHTMYSMEDMTPQLNRVERITPDGVWIPTTVFTLIAPINDSIYVPQNSQWYRYAEMHKLGFTDILGLRLYKRARGEEAPLQ